MALFQENIDHVFELEVGGQRFFGWTTASATRSVKNMTGRFKFTIHDPQMLLFGSPAYTQFSTLAEPGTDCKVFVDGDLFMTGKIDTRHARKNAKSHDVDISGRGKSRDAIDSHHVDKTTQYNNKKPSDITETVLAKFGVKIENRDTDEKPIPVYRYFMGDTAFNVIQEVTSQQGITVTENNKGVVVLRSKDKGPAAGTLIQGENLLEYTVNKTDKDKAKNYEGVGQSVPSGRVRGKGAFYDPHHKVVDGQTKGNRTIVVTAPSDVDKDKVKRHTFHEAARRAGYSLRVQVRLYGYRGSSGQLWEPDTLAFTYIPDENVAEDLLIESVTFEKGPRGTITRLRLTRKEAYEGKPSNGKKQGPRARVSGGSKAPQVILGNGSTGETAG